MFVLTDKGVVVVWCPCSGDLGENIWRHYPATQKHDPAGPAKTRPGLSVCQPALQALPLQTWSGDVPLYKEGFSPLGPTYILPHLLIVGLTLPSTATALYETKTQSPAKEEIISGVTKMLVMPLLAVIHRPVDQFLSKPFV